MQLNRSQISSRKKTELSQILNPEARILRPAEYPSLQGHISEYHNRRNVDVGFEHPSQHWNSRDNSGRSASHSEYANDYYTNETLERWGRNTEYAAERAAVSADRDYPNQVPNVGPDAFLNNNHHHPHPPMFSDSSQNSHSQFQIAERVSSRILAQQSVAPNPHPVSTSNQQYEGDSSRKRTSPPEDVGSSQQKKAKKPPSIPSKRGFTKKKRSETAALQEQNAYLAPSVTYVPEKGQEPTSENRMRMLQAEESTAFGAATLTPELQTARCMSSKYKPEDFPRCVSCTRRWAGDTCRFQGIRIFMKNEKKEVVGMGFVNNQKAEKPAMDFPKKWNVGLADKDIQWTMRVTAKQVLPILLQERRHVNTQQIIYRPREIDVRATCDCYEEIVALTSDPNADLRKSGSPASPELEAQMTARLAAQQSLKEKQNHSKPFFLSCTKRAEHRAAEFTPVSRFCLQELEEAIRGMEAILSEEEGEEGGQAMDLGNEELNSTSSTSSDSTGISTPPETNVHFSALNVEKERSYPKGHLYPPSQSYSQQPYHPYQYSAQYPHQQQPYVSQLQAAHGLLASSTNPDRHQQARMQEHYTTESSEHHQSQSSHYSSGLPSYINPDSLQGSEAYTQSPYIRSQPDSNLLNDTITSTPRAPSISSQNVYQPSSHNSKIPLHPIPTYTFDALTATVFQKIWRKSTPILVTDVGQRFRVRWTPEYFIKEYGEQSCLIIECQTDTNRRVTVGEFFAEFGKYADRPRGPSEECSVPESALPDSNGEARPGSIRKKGEIWKLKDWPPSADFKTTFPELYEDFSQAVPIPNYVRRDGKLNIASHFPQNALAPDLGPKMYNAMASYQDHGSRGSTRLHMDMADALNVMTYAADCPDGSPGCAAWDLFRVEDSVKLRGYLKKKFSGTLPMDPIHGQQVYLNEAMRKELAEEYDVYSFRVYQRSGEAIFIPAGCAHQVCNLADCIKVAVDFVSPENVQRCEKLTQEFREQNQSKVWKEDVLQLKTMMWFAWLSCSRQLEERKQNQMEGVSLTRRDSHEATSD
ncbi:hypothetical protein F5050DRAFT_1804039 [Lentinula boryana]|uniref:JmjC domain-containing protein n=1 Tax=Lentinula boryana TaxID=40481 RepID=A0ABQ8QQ97_9AGAR|nr:hypothetical protein F5050DRAFT_1804039 [Lentinula boryana]